MNRGAVAERPGVVALLIAYLVGLPLAVFLHSIGPALFGQGNDPGGVLVAVFASVWYGILAIASGHRLGEAARRSGQSEGIWAILGIVLGAIALAAWLLLGSPDSTDEAGGGQLSWLRDAVEVIVIALVLYVTIWNCIQTVKVDGRSMVNTLQDGDLLIASKISYRLGAPERGDIVILTPPPYCEADKTAAACSPGAAALSRDFIKRVVGLPGDSVEIDGNQHPTALLIQPGGTGPWTKLTEPYLPNDWVSSNQCCKPDGQRSDQPHVYKIPAGSYFVMGDNRNESNDSRFFGVVPKEKIEAKAVVRIWPLGSFGSLGPQMTLLLSAHPVAFALVWRRNRRVRRELAALEGRR